jgi:hypothetical protein
MCISCELVVEEFGRAVAVKAVSVCIYMHSIILIEIIIHSFFFIYISIYLNKYIRKYKYVDVT